MKVLINGSDVDAAVECGLKKATREMHSPQHTMEACSYIRKQGKCNDEVVPLGVMMHFELTKISAYQLSEEKRLPGMLVNMIMNFYVRKELEKLHPEVEENFKACDAHVKVQS